MTVVDLDKAREKKEGDTSELLTITPKGWLFGRLIQMNNSGLSMEEYNKFWEEFENQIRRTAIAHGCDKDGIPALVFEEGGVPITI